MTVPLRTAAAAALCFSAFAIAEPLPPSMTYRQLPTEAPSVIAERDRSEKPKVMERQRRTLEHRYDLSDKPRPGVMMAGGRKAVQQGVRVKLAAGATWESLAAM